MIKNVAVIGAGTMGNGIAQVFAQKGFQVRLVDISQESLQGGLATIGRNLDRMIAKEVIDKEDKELTLQRIQTFTSIEHRLSLAQLM